MYLNETKTKTRQREVLEPIVAFLGELGHRAILRGSTESQGWLGGVGKREVQ